MKRAVDLFGGDAEARRRMTSALRDRFEKLSVGELRDMEGAYRLKQHTLVDLALGKGGQDMVDYPLFEAVAPAVRLSIHEVLGQPQMSAEDKAYWTREMEEHPLDMMGSMSEAAPDARTIKLYQYLVSRTIEEINTDKGSIYSVLTF